MGKWNIKNNVTIGIMRAKNSVSAFRLRYLPSLLFCVIATILIYAPYQSESPLGGGALHDVLYIVVCFLMAIVVVCLLPIVKKEKITRESLLAMIPAFVLVLFNIMHRNGDASIGGVISVLWVIFCAFPADMKRKTFLYFRNVWVVICIVGIVCYLAFLINAPLPWREVSYYWGGDSLKYIDYGVSFLYKDRLMVRLCGICNEPGLLGTISALFLCADKMNLRRKSNIIIFIAGLMTFSVAFIIMILVYVLGRFIILTIKEKNRRKKIYRMAVLFTCLLAWIFVLPNIHTGNSMIDYTLQRLALTSDGMLAGDNRTTAAFDKEFDRTFSQNPLFGQGKGYVNEMGLEKNLSYKIYLLEYGIVGCVLIWGTLAVAVMRKNMKNFEIMLFVLVFFISIYQRPLIITPSYAIVLLGGVEYLKSLVCNAKNYH